MFRFTIRDVLGATLIVGLSLGWWLDHRTQADRENRVFFGMAVELGKEGRASRLVGDSLVFCDNGTQRNWVTVRLADVMIPLGNNWFGVSDRPGLLPGWNHHLSDEELQLIKRRSAELGAPQPLPLPLGYGDTPK